MIMAGEYIDYESDMADGFADIAKDLDYEGVADEDTPEMEVVKEQAAAAFEGNARMHERNGDPVDTSTAAVGQVVDQVSQSVSQSAGLSPAQEVGLALAQTL